MEKYRPPEIIDRLIDQDDNGYNFLLLDPKDINKKAADTYAHQFRSRNINISLIKNIWQHIYEPKAHFASLYSPLNEEIDLITWSHILSLINKSSAAGNSGIPYPLITHLPSIYIELTLKLFNVILRTGLVPNEWKLSTIIPIPKPHKFGYDMTNVRPIALLDVFRKIYTKILTERLSSILLEHNILCKENYCGLKGDSTNTPIHLINNICEDAKANDKELWMLTQDISKVFDSISIHGLTKALDRLSVPNNIVRFILSLFTNRYINILTAYGTTDIITAGDRIDQGDSISPLLWRIFYDPLLSAVTRYGS